MSNSLVLARLEDVYLEPDEDRRQICCTCSICEEDIREGDEYYEILGETICECCTQEAHRYAEVD